MDDLLRRLELEREGALPDMPWLSATEQAEVAAYMLGFRVGCETERRLMAERRPRRRSFLGSLLVGWAVGLGLAASGIALVVLIAAVLR